jgi:hypothetical protein
MSAPSSLPLADTSDMAGLHRVFREAFEAAPRLVGRAPGSDGGRAEVVGSYYDNVLRLLHGHHEGEDELLTPKLLARCPEASGLIERISAQHIGVLAAIDAVETGIAEWRRDPSAANRDAVATSLTELDQVLTPHLDEEELEIVPLAATCIDVAEWGELPEHGMRTFTATRCG